MSARKIKVELPKGVNIKNIDLTRFNKLPILLINHNWGEIRIGKALDVILSKKGLYLKPQFNSMTDASKNINYLNKQGLITKGYPGGFVHKDKNGNIEKFELFEVSICP